MSVISSSKAPYSGRVQIALLLSATLLCLVLPARSQGELPDGNGKEIVEAVCTQCHGLEAVTGARLTSGEWQNTVNQMVANGASLTENQSAVVTEYLARNFQGEPKPNAAAMPARSQAGERVDPARDAALRASRLPDGNGKQIVQTVCTQCHPAARVAIARHSPQDWEYVIKLMLGNAPMKLAKGDIAIVRDYLAKNFPGESEPVGISVPGPAKVDIKEWHLKVTETAYSPLVGATRGNLTGGARIHSPLVTPDGTVWFVGGKGVGQFDPKTGTAKDYPARTQGGHGLTYDGEGNIWFTASGRWGLADTAPVAGTIGKLNPKTGEVIEYFINIPPNAPRSNPHTPIFDRKRGLLWFTLGVTNMIGRLNPKTEEMKLVTMPTPDAHPYDAFLDSNGIPYFTEFGTNRLARLDPDTMEIYEYIMPNPASRPKRIGFTTDGALWFTDHGRGYLTRLDLKTGKFSEWPSPSGRESGPYGLAVTGDIVWFSENSTKPGTIVRFDTKTEKFQSWAVPSGEGSPHLFAAPDGTVWFATAGGGQTIGRVVESR